MRQGVMPGHLKGTNSLARQRRSVNLAGTVPMTAFQNDGRKVSSFVRNPRSWAGIGPGSAAKTCVISDAGQGTQGAGRSVVPECCVFCRYGRESGPENVLCAEEKVSLRFFRRTTGGRRSFGRRGPRLVGAKRGPGRHDHDVGMGISGGMKNTRR